MSASHPIARAVLPAGSRFPAGLLAATGLHLRTWLECGRLDRLLAQGTSADASPELGLRARQLGRPRACRRLARALEALVHGADRGVPTLSARPPVRWPEVRRARVMLLAIARELRDRPSPNPRGIALVQRLLVDGDGPLYVAGQTEDLWRAAYHAFAELVWPADGFAGHPSDLAAIHSIAAGRSPRTGSGRPLRVPDAAGRERGAVDH